jgi:hypothetical protein
LIIYENKGSDKKNVPKINVEQTKGNGKSYSCLYPIQDLTPCVHQPRKILKLTMNDDVNDDVSNYVGASDDASNR